ncbi:TIGR04255 family protein [Rhizobium sp. 9140]|uniref:TIGR04255 family protein n=1 Tax=Rhizobium sp. 9140 TaxID=1761900 RepID=UPI0007920A3C|nr:TIGR04255 family protein [Rhizobium sp. 9140]CZT36111.1 TIGR04255 family protein [Rhizobium sp. 9140]
MRSRDLPEFDNPPLNEMIVGVQFNPAETYSQIRAGEVWSLFKKRYPLHEEHPPLLPQFETFGLPAPPQFGFNMVNGGQHDRFWFLTPDRRELIQFQEDRLLHNWRQVDGAPTVKYPRFENILDKFSEEATELSRYFSSIGSRPITFNQAEITYTNHIVLNNSDIGSTHVDYLNVLNLERVVDPDDIVFIMRRVLSNGENPFARLIVEAKTAVHNQTFQRMVVLSLTVRGNPPDGSLEDVLWFLKLGHEVIVEEFTAITTDYAHEVWGRTY